MAQEPGHEHVMDLSIIIVNWNSRDYLRKCIGSILATPLELAYEIVVIDAGSFDGCGQMLSETFPRVRFVQSQKNVGFARANNEAFQVSHGQCVLFLNPDTEEVGPAISAMYARLQTLSGAGAVGCKLLNPDRTIQTSCIQSFPTIINQILDAECLRSRWPKAALWGMAPLYESGSEPKTVEAISGACIMLKRQVFQQVGLFSEDYFMYAEDIDLCYKVKQAGYKNYYIPEATVIHYGGGSAQTASSNFSFVMMRESNWRFLRKTQGRYYGMVYRASMLVCAFVRLLLLAALFPVRRARQQRDALSASVRKWQAVWRWSLYGQQTIEPYQ